MTLRLNLEDLICSAVHTAGQCEDLASGHLVSGNRIDAARNGWVDSSAEAIDAKLTAWHRESDSLLARLGDHARGLQGAAALFTETELRRGAALTVEHRSR